MKVLVTGANGYIGNAVANELRRRGHSVYGLVRNAEAASALTSQEIIGIIGNVDDPSVIQLLENGISLVIDTISPDSKGPQGSDPSKYNRTLFNQIKTIAKAQSRVIRYIYTSGCLVYGDHSDKSGHIVYEQDQLRETRTVWRSNFENEIIASSLNGSKESPDFFIRATVVRPGWVYGLSNGKYLSMLTKLNEKGEIVIRGRGDKKWGWVHILDLASGYSLLAENPSLADGEIFNITDDSRATFEQVVVGLCRANGIDSNISYVPLTNESGPFWNLIEQSAIGSNLKFKKTFNWQPSRSSILDELAIVVKASNQINSNSKNSANNH